MLNLAEQQKIEIETIRERNITVKLSDADCERISKLCGEHGLSIGELIANFIGDLVYGTYSNGSDERDYARRYFERCWFGMFPENTLLKFLLESCWYGVDEFLALLDNIKDGYNDFKEYETNPDVYDEEEIEYLKNNIEDWEHEFAEIKSDFEKTNEKADWKEEISNVKKWFEEMEKMRDE